MSEETIRSAYSVWPQYNRRLREVVATLTEQQLAMTPSKDRWPLWATAGHTACQRVFWLCDFAGAPGAETTRFTNAANDCPGDDDLEHVLSAEELVESLDSTFRIVETCLDGGPWSRWPKRSATPSGRGTGCTPAAGSCSGSSATTSITAPR